VKPECKEILPLHLATFLRITSQSANLKLSTGQQANTMWAIHNRKLNRKHPADYLTLKPTANERTGFIVHCDSTV